MLSAASSPARGRSTCSTLIAIVWAARGGRRPHQLLPRPAPRPRVPGAPRRRGCRSPRSASSRSRASSTATAARRSSSGASSGSCAPIAPFLAGSSRDAAAALPALRRRRRRPLGHDASSCSATSSGRASTSSSTTPRRARSRSARSSSLVVGDRVASCAGCASAENRRRHTRVAGRARRERPAAAAAGACVARRRSVRGDAPPRALRAGTASRPGDLGLELTTLLAVAAVGAFVFVWRPRRASSSAACSPATACRCAWPTGCTPTRSSTSQGGDVPRLAAGGDRARRARRGVVLVARREIARGRWRSSPAWRSPYAAVHIAKDAVDRAAAGAPARRRDGRELSRRATRRTRRPGWRSRSRSAARCPGSPALRVRRSSAIVIAVVVGLSRIYLRAHYLSDVVGGLGAGRRRSSRSCGIAALVVGYVRNNARRTPTADEQRVDHLPRRRLQRRLRPGRLRRPHPRARLDGLQPRLGAPGRDVPLALRAGRRS